jgi:NAD(P)-dependent dehydrogenase (short-subunit alcohol dehydrogenase family)
MMVASKDLLPLTASFFPTIFWEAQFCYKPQWPPEDTSLSEKVAIVTGANTGLGYDCARQLLSFKLSHLIIAVRSAEKGEAAAAKLRAQYPEATVEVWPLDMNSYSSIQAFAGRAESQLPRLDAAILNAGVSKTKFDVVPSTGHEEVIQVNYLSMALLSILLLPILKSKSPAGTPGRLTIVSSALALNAKFPNSKQSPLLPSFDNPKTTPFDPHERYSSSKLLGHMFLYKLVDYVSAEDVVVNLVEPGFINGTGLHRDMPGILSAGLAVFKAVAARPVKVGASTYLDASCVKGKEAHGCFLMNWQIRP